MVGSYPIVNPQHGGQKRAAAIFSEYSKQHKVKYLSVVHPYYYQQRTQGDITVSKETVKEIEAQPLLIDIVCGQAANNDSKVHGRILKVLKSFKPNIIHFEQPYMYLGFSKILAKLNYAGLIINGTQNIESIMKKEIYKAEGLSLAIAREKVRLIEELEEHLAHDAALNVVVSEDDASQLKKLYNAKNVVLAPNGIKPVSTTDETKQKWSMYYESQGIKKIVVFVGSAHLPNMTGFLKMVGEKVGFLPHTARVVVVGGVAELFKRHIDDKSIAGLCFQQRVELLGRLEDEDLGALLQISNVILLPITEGGGSNLKTAEALLTNKRIVSTSYALRGYKVNNLPNIDVADNSKDFKKSIIDSINLPEPALNKGQRQITENFLWPSTLRNLIETVGKL